MPLYDIEHITALTPPQQAQLAQSLTALHVRTFHTPRFFVNVRFTDVSSVPTYRGGVLRQYNRAILRTRAGESRTVEVLNKHCENVVGEWEKVVGGEGEKALRTVWVMGALSAAVEMGVARPKVGEEREWLQANKEKFRALADAGDEDFIALMEEELKDE